VDFFTEQYVRSQRAEHDNELARAELGSQVMAARRSRRRPVIALVRQSVTSIGGRFVKRRRRQTVPTVATPAAPQRSTP